MTCVCIIPCTIMLFLMLIRHCDEVFEKVFAAKNVSSAASSLIIGRDSVIPSHELVPREIHSPKEGTVIPPQIQHRQIQSNWPFQAKKITARLPRLEAVVPGVNLDVSGLPWYLLSLLMCTAIHEAGHAVSAVSEGITLLTVGCAVIWCFPIAFVTLDLRDEIPSGRRLRTLCAGVWCNAVFCLACLLIAFLIPSFSLLLSTQKSGVYIGNVSTHNPLHGHLKSGDKILEINHCRLHTIQDIDRCLSLDTNGFCLTDEEVRAFKIKLLKHDDANEGASAGVADHQCCANSPSGLCFSKIETFNTTWRTDSHCLNMRRISAVKQGKRDLCYNSSSECAARVGASCYFPRLGDGKKVFVINKQLIKSDAKQQPIVLIGEKK